MKIWKEYELELFNYFDWYNEKKNNINKELIGRMSVVSLNASGLYKPEDSQKFIKLCNNELLSFFDHNGDFNEYNFYLIVNKQIKNVNSKVENYKKIWSDLDRNIGLHGIKKGPEIRIDLIEGSYFSSIAQLDKTNFISALEIVSSNPRMNTIIIGKEANILTEHYIKNLFHELLETNTHKFKEIDYFKLCEYCCCQDNIAIRWGSSFEEVELALIYNNKTLNNKMDNIFSNVAQIS